MDGQKKRNFAARMKAKVMALEAGQPKGNVVDDDDEIPF
jgi:hypothetical protein